MAIEPSQHLPLFSGNSLPTEIRKIPSFALFKNCSQDPPVFTNVKMLVEFSSVTLKFTLNILVRNVFHDFP